MTIISENINEASEIHRQHAREFAALRDESFQKSQRCYNSGNKALAKTFSNEGKRYQYQMERKNKEAAEIIFARNNSHRSTDKIDLHGLFVNEAIEKLKDRISTAKRNGKKQLVVIVGKGNNSPNGPKIKPAVNEFARANRIPFRSDFPNPGCILLELSQVDHRHITLEDYDGPSIVDIFRFFINIGSAVVGFVRNLFGW